MEQRTGTAWGAAVAGDFLTGTIERFGFDQVVEHADTDPVKHMRLAALQRSRPLLGAELMVSWRSRACGYPTNSSRPWWNER